MFICTCNVCVWGFSGDSVVQNTIAKAGDAGPIAGLGRSPGEENGNPLHPESLPGNPTDREAWQLTVCGVEKELDMT